MERSAYGSQCHVPYLAHHCCTHTQTHSLTHRYIVPFVVPASPLLYTPTYTYTLSHIHRIYIHTTCIGKTAPMARNTICVIQYNTIFVIPYNTIFVIYHMEKQRQWLVIQYGNCMGSFCLFLPYYCCKHMYTHTHSHTHVMPCVIPASLLQFTHTHTYTLSHIHRIHIHTQHA